MLATGPHSPQAQLAGADGGAVAARAARGWGARAVGNYEYAPVTGANGAEAGRILINLHPQAQSLDAHCGTCGSRLNRRFLARAGAGERASAHPQGRPMGALVAWLRLPCHGSRDDHRASYAELSLQERQEARAWAQAQLAFQPLFERERPRRAGEGEEPERLC